MKIAVVPTTLTTWPSPHGVTAPVFSETAYAQLLAQMPSLTEYAWYSGGYVKKAFSDDHHPDAFAAFLDRTPLWREWHETIQDPSVGRELHARLTDDSIVVTPPPYRVRWEFSALPAAGGHLPPHTDVVSKVMSLILSLGTAHWDPLWGGGTDFLVPAPQGGFTVGSTVPHVPNRALLFVRTPTSWHSVGPLQGPASAWRHTLTVIFGPGAG